MNYKFPLHVVISFLCFFLSLSNSYIIKNFRVQIENNFFSYSQKNKISSLIYSCYNPFLHEHNKLKKKVYPFKIFVNNENLKEKSNIENGESVKVVNILKEDQSDEVRAEKGYNSSGNSNDEKEKNERCGDNKNSGLIIYEQDNSIKKNNILGKEQGKESSHKVNYTTLNAHCNGDLKDKNNGQNRSIYEHDRGSNVYKSEKDDINHVTVEGSKGNSKEDVDYYKESSQIDGKMEQEAGKEGEEGENSYECKNQGMRKTEKKKKIDMDLKIIRNLPLISIIGRPNVGKSTIFNRLTRKFQDGSIVLSESSTRDKFYGEVEWDGYKFELVDTGGLLFEDDKFTKEIRNQIMLALEESSVVLLVVDGLHGVHPVDHEICRFLRKYLKNKYKKEVSNITQNEEINCSLSNEQFVVNEEIKTSPVKKIDYNTLEKMGNQNTSSHDVLFKNESTNDTLINIPLNNSIHENISNKNSNETDEKNYHDKSAHKLNDEHKAHNKYKTNTLLKVIVCVNKCESYKDGQFKAQDFWELGFDTPFACSGIHGNGLSEILDECIKYIKKVEINELEEELNEKNTINISFIGKPNTGKSSILNKILNCNRFIVSPIAGTTVDSIDVLVKIKDSDRIYRLIDTAGIQKKKKHISFNERTRFEYLLYNRTEKAIKRSDVCVLVIDSFNGISSHDINIARKILQENKSCIICCNKWDLIYNKNDIFNDTKNYVLNLLKPIDFADILFISAKTSQRLPNIFEHAEETYKNYTRRVNTNSLNAIIKEALLLRPPIPVKNKTLNIYYAFQKHVKPPGFVFFCNSEKSAYVNYTKYLENRIRETFNLKGTPIKIYYKQKRKRNLIKKIKNPDKYNLDIEAIQKNFTKMQSEKQKG
ncbi:GTP-binding protein, putative [Plasmodium malariae]|uniref:GTPase Der n=1 Tax=Plasmodium malariae TaxID=5858 RepID=A0A1A8WFC3_PLAMA|nr:GTP-binding protein, putative [Plasmodium malariae]